jgi:RNA polymerase sigma factor (sigma-70 family)
MQDTHLVMDDEISELDSFLGNVLDLPLLTADQEKDLDLRKRAALRSMLRTLTSDASSRDLLLELCTACVQQPPSPETLQSRSVYFHLRKDIGNLLPGKSGSEHLLMLQQQLLDEADTATLMSTLHRTSFPATLIVGIAAVRLRMLGLNFKDASADALCIWIKPWSHLLQTENKALRDELHDAVQRYLKNRNKLVSHNMRLVYKIARDNQLRSIPLTDLIQEGAGGLIRAAEKFDHRLGYRFSTYSYHWINQHIQRACEGNGSLISYPSNVHKDINQLHRLRSEQMKHEGIRSSTQYLSTQSGMSVDKVQRLRSTTNITVPIDQPLTVGSTNTWENSLADPASESAPDAANNGMLSKMLASKLEVLEDMEQRVVTGRYGLLGQNPQTLRQLSESLDISSEWARQLERSALKKLRSDQQLAEACDNLGA